MDMINLRQTCKEINLPLCRAIGKRMCGYTSRSGDLVFMQISSPITVAFLIFVILCALRMLDNTEKHYAAVGRQEFILFIYLYLAAILVELINVCEFEFLDSYLEYLVILQLTLASTAAFVLLVGGITPQLFMVMGFINSMTVLRLSGSLYFIISGSLASIGIFSKSGEFLFFSLFLTTLIVLVAFVISQLVILRNHGAEVWAFGTLAISCVFFILSIIVLFIGSFLITFFSERYLDSLFIFHLLSFCTVLMVHKYWQSICDFEAECAALVFEEEDAIY